MTKPFPYQIQGSWKIHHFNGRALLADEMGLGKSYQSLLWLIRHPKVRPAIILCPASLKWNWQKETITHIGMRSEVLEGTKPFKRGFTPHQLVILNYDILWPWMNYLKSLSPKAVIIDECHMISNIRTKRTKGVRLLCKNIPHVIALSGTPLTNRPAELWPILNLIRPDLFPNFFSFASRYCEPRRAPWGWVYSGATNLKELHTILTDNLMIRRTKKEVLPQLPTKQRNIIPVDIINPKEYQNALKDFLGWLSKKSPEKVKKAKRAEKLVRVGYLKRLVGILKLPYILEWIDDFLANSDEKLVVFGIHKEVIKQIHKKYRNISVVINGEVSPRKREIARERFHSHKSCRIFIGNIKAAGVGVNLVASSHLIFTEIGWTPGEHSQAEDRIHRIGQKDSVSCYYLIARNTIEEHLIKLIENKKEVIHKTLDGEEDFNTDILDQLIEILQKENGT